MSDQIEVQPGKRYTFGFYFKTANGPSYVGGQISVHDSQGKYLRNDASGFGGTTRDGEWQEYVLPFIAPKDAAFISCQAFKADNTKPCGIVWVDEFYLGAGFGLDQPPSPKKPFEGAHVRVDALGNFEIKRKEVWTPIFPLCMFSDNHRQWSVYSQQGWNTIMWTGAAHQVREAKEAVSDFNPDGMLAGFQISQFTFPSGWGYNKLDSLREQLKEIFDQGLDDNLLLYYWDNENNHDQWKVPVDVFDTIKNIDVNSTRQRLHPIYALQGTYNIARVHAAKGLIDVSGTYFGGKADNSDGVGLDGFEAMVTLDRHHGQTSPAPFAQFNSVEGPGDMRLRLYNSITVGAKAMGYWRDCYKACDDQFMKSVGPVDKKLWWPDFPNLRREIDQLLPIIREPHWTPWKASLNTEHVRVGTRNHKDKGHLILINQTTRPQKVAISLQELPYAATEVLDVLTKKKLATITDGSFSITLPGIGVGTGTAVLRLD